MLGVLPFLLLLGSLVSRILSTIVWMYRTANPSHPAVPLAILMTAGLIHAAFEDWLFAPGYYLCVFFWSMAFVFVDQSISLSLADPRSMWFRHATHDAAESGYRRSESMMHLFINSLAASAAEASLTSVTCSPTWLRTPACESPLL